MKYLLMAFMAVACCSFGCDRREDASRPSSTAAVRVKDPVCGMMVDRSTAPKSVTWEGTTYHFCSKDCADKFDRAPGTYVK